MIGLKCVTVIVATIFISSLVESKEFVPVYMWSTQRLNGKVPALHRLGEGSFKDDIVEHLKENPYLVVFAEPTLSPEDFTQRDQSGELVFTKLAKLKSSMKTSYLPNVQNPVNALKHLETSVAEVSVESINENSQYPESKVLIINMNDAKDGESRLDMLKRHDGIISSIFENVRSKHENVLAIYTARHTSWVGSENVPHYRRTRDLLQTGDEPTPTTNFSNTDYAFVYFTYAQYVLHNESNPNEPGKVTNVTLTVTSKLVDDSSVIVTFSGTNLTLEMKFTKDIVAGYYQLIEPVNATIENKEQSFKSAAEVYAPVHFSYHCGDQILINDTSKDRIFFKNFQIEAFNNGTINYNKTQFNDAYDCVGFTTIPIWSGLFVTTILLIIMSLGITMMMDIRTMDRFDDAKGKTITINASE